MYAQRGSALFLILIAVALFAALSYAITQSGRGSGNTKKETAALQASRLLQWASSLGYATQRVEIINGCNADAMSRDAFAGNPASNPGPCNIFDRIEGGGATYNMFPDGDPSIYTSGITTAEWKVNRFINSMDVWGVNSSQAEVIFVMFNIDPDVCKAINRQAAIVTSDGEPPWESSPYEGGWNDPHGTNLLGGNGALTIGRNTAMPPNELTGQLTGCYRAPRAGIMGQHFYYVLKAH